MSDISNGAPMGQGGAGVGPYDPKEKSVGAEYFKRVNADLQKRFGKKNPTGAKPAKKA